ncbi:DNA (cytosine-5-)-methyltransferase [Lysinibacillus capsici]|nr:DNA (cytosine-5-)-methyltransferase [Lysinibacillus capsici]
MVRYIAQDAYNQAIYFSGEITTCITTNVGKRGRNGINIIELYEINEMEDFIMPYVKHKKEKEEIIIKSFTYASAFAGIGGMTLGLKPLGGEGVIAWEYDPTEKRRQYAQDAHKLLHPEIPIHGDICEANTDELPDFDVFCFTPPCQAFSVAGKRGGFDDTRGTLTFEALRIAQAKKPKILFMENVKGLVNHDKGNTMGTIIHAINEIGYTVDFTVLNSKYFDVAQNRERVYLIAFRDDLISPEPWNDVKGTTMLPKAKRRYQEEGARTFNFDWPEQTEVLTRLRDFLEPIVDEKYYIDEEKTAKLVAQLEEKADGIVIREATNKGYAVAAEGDAVNIQFPNSKTRRGRVGKQMANTLEANGCNQGVVERIEQFSKGDGISCCIDANYAKGTSPGDVGKGRRTHIVEDSPIMLGHIDLKGHDAIKRVYSPTGQGPTLTTMGGGHREPKIVEEIRPVLTPERLEKRQNGRRFKEDGEESFTLTSIDRHGVAVGEYPKYRIRKLTPRECLRLQSVPEDIIDALSTHFSDSRLYHFAGNGLTTKVITAIGERLIKYL